MQVNKELAGKAKYGVEEYGEPICLKEMSLEYYLIESDSSNQKSDKLNVYGIEIIKTEVDKSNSVKTEFELVPNISSDKEGVKEILDKLVRYKVTPIALHDVLEDFSRIMN
ncbi:MAG: DUF6514 family protein [Deltaproteobacteria bacterium]